MASDVWLKFLNHFFILTAWIALELFAFFIHGDKCVFYRDHDEVVAVDWANASAGGRSTLQLNPVALHRVILQVHNDLNVLLDVLQQLVGRSWF